VERPRFRTLLGAAATLAVIAGVCFVVQAAALGQATGNELLAAKVVGSLVGYHESETMMVINGARETSVCHDARNDQGQREKVVLDGRFTLLKVGDNLLEPGKRALVEFELAGCPRALGDWLAAQLNQGKRVRIHMVRLDGRRLYSLRVPSAGLGLELFVSPRNELPVTLHISGPGVHGASFVHYGAPPARVPYGSL
jgi:hypothetical protein